MDREETKERLETAGLFIIPIDDQEIRLLGGNRLGDEGGLPIIDNLFPIYFEEDLWCINMMSSVFAPETLEQTNSFVESLAKAVELVIEAYAYR